MTIKEAIHHNKCWETKKYMNTSMDEDTIVCMRANIRNTVVGDGGDHWVRFILP